jgi:hypothetical protein
MVKFLNYSEDLMELIGEHEFLDIFNNIMECLYDNGEKVNFGALS